MRCNVKRSATVAVVAALTLVPLALVQSSAQAEDQPPPDPVTSSSSTIVPGSELDFVDGDDPSDAHEAQAVETYVDGAPDEGAELTAEDVQVATVDLPEDLEATVVAPDTGTEVKSVNVQVDAEENTIRAGGKFQDDANELTSAGPGMGSWPRWEDSPSWSVQITVYRKNNNIGMARFQTQRQKYKNDQLGYDLWRVARRAYGQPGVYEHDNLPDTHLRIGRLWISSDLESHEHARQWRDDLTKPQGSWSKCESGTSVTAGPFTFTPKNCEDYDTWTGAIGHYRFDYNQGSNAGEGNRAIAYVAGFAMDKGASVKGDWYEFVELRWSAFGDDDKCTANTAGEEGGTTYLRCDV